MSIPFGQAGHDLEWANRTSAGAGDSSFVTKVTATCRRCKLGGTSEVSWRLREGGEATSGAFAYWRERNVQYATWMVSGSVPIGQGRCAAEPIFAQPFGRMHSPKSRIVTDAKEVVVEDPTSGALRRMTPEERSKAGIAIEGPIDIRIPLGTDDFVGRDPPTNEQIDELLEGMKRKAGR